VNALPQRQGGYMLLGAILAVGLFAVMMQRVVVPALNRAMEETQVGAASQQLEQVLAAAQRYVENNYGTLTASLPLNGAPTTISAAQLKTAGALHPSIGGAQTLNNYGQSYTLGVRYVTQGSGTNVRNVLEPVLVTTGGRELNERELRAIAARVPGGGFVDPGNSALARGFQGSWGPINLASYGVNPGPGRVAVAMFYLDAAAGEGAYLYRSAVPGRPELNRMNTTLNMGGQDIAQADEIATRTLSSTADITVGRDLVTSRDVQSGRDLRVNRNASVQGTATVYGTLTADARLRVNEYLHLARVATEGATCPTNGLIARNAAGAILSCTSGRWWAAGTGDVWFSPTYSITSNTRTGNDVPSESRTDVLGATSQFRYCSVAYQRFSAADLIHSGFNFSHSCNVRTSGSNWQLITMADTGTTWCQALCLR